MPTIELILTENNQRSHFVLQNGDDGRIVHEFRLERGQVIEHLIYQNSGGSVVTPSGCAVANGVTTAIPLDYGSR